MRILFIHQNFPGQFKLLAAYLAQQPGVEVMGLGDAANLKKQARTFSFPVRGYPARPTEKSDAHHYLGSFERAIRRGQDVVRACQRMRAEGFVPDLVVGHPAWGELLFVKDVLPDARLIAYFEFFYRAVGADVGFDPEFPSTPPVQEVIRDGENGFLFGFFEREQLVSPAIDVLKRDNSDVILAAQRDIDANFSFQRNSLPAYRALIDQVAGAGAFS